MGIEYELKFKADSAALAAIGSAVGEMLSFIIPLGGRELLMVLF